jgi:hypothetical protein
MKMIKKNNNKKNENHIEYKNLMRLNDEGQNKKQNKL